MRKLFILFLSALLIFTSALPVFADEQENSSDFDLTAKGAILMEATTGTILYEKDAHAKLRPASVTKVMTLLLIFEALENNQFTLDDEVTVSEHAASMGGSQVYLEPGEVQTVQDLIKCISIASANDASTAMAEFVAGSESAFVDAMNAKAKALGMEDTNFVNCCGLDAEGHVTSAYDVAVMSRELITKYPQIHDYCTVWMDTIIHKTKRGESEFGLSNTNKLIKQYSYATGLKTGSTSLAKYSVSATAQKDGVSLIAVIMAAADYKVRFSEAVTLLDYGFSKCKVYTDENPPALNPIPVKNGTMEALELNTNGIFSYVDTKGIDFSQITAKLSLPKEIKAPISAGETVGTIDYTLNGKVIGQIPVYAKMTIEKATFPFYLRKLLTMFAL